MRLHLLLSAVLLTACGGTKDDADATSTPAPADSGEGEGELEGPTWHADVQPVMATHCTRCHQEGGLGPGDFTDPAVVTALAPAMLGAMEAGQMPPAASDPTCRDYSGSEHLTLPSEALDTFSAWVAADMPEGTPGEATETVEINGELADPDVVLMMEAPYTPTFADTSNPGNEYRCFAIEADDLAGKSITAMAPVIGTDPLVHHIVLFTLPHGSVSDEMLTPSGWDCIDGMGSDALDGMLTAWAPGMLPVEFPEGHGLAVPEEHYLVAQVHYFYSGPEHDGKSDQSGYAFNVAEGPVTPVYMAPVSNFGFSIPPGAVDYSETETLENTFTDLKVLGIFPHMHKYGTYFDARIKHADGSESCLVNGAWNFNNQMTYQFTEPAEYKIGDELEYTCTWSNEDGTDAITYGERTDEEMCYFFTFVTL